MDKIAAVEAAVAYIEAKGEFEFVARSGLSEACYFRRPGYADNFRIAAHACHHPLRIAANLTIEYREAWERDEGRVGWIASLSDIYRECENLIAEYDANAEIEED